MIMGWNKLQTRWRQQSFRHVAPIAVGLYELTLLGWLIWAGTQLGTLGNLSIFKHYPYIVTVILASLSIHVVVVGVLEFWLIRQCEWLALPLSGWLATNRAKIPSLQPPRWLSTPIVKAAVRYDD